MEAEPIDVVQHVDLWIEDELVAVARSEHRQLLDEDTCYNLHALARTIYALGVHDGIVQQGSRDNSARQRDRLRAQAAATKDTDL